MFEKDGEMCEFFTIEPEVYEKFEEYYFELKERSIEFITRLLKNTNFCNDYEYIDYNNFEFSNGFVDLKLTYNDKIKFLVRFDKEVVCDEEYMDFIVNKVKEENIEFSEDIYCYNFSNLQWSLVPRTNTNSDKVNHPSHYTWLKEKCGIEVIDITRHMDFDLGNAIKYILRAGHKSEEGYDDKEKQIEDLRKAIWYITDEINNLLK
jgi:hypothetical protein